MRKLLSLITAASLATSTLAHFSIYGVWLNGEFQGDGRHVYERTKVHWELNPPYYNSDWAYIACNTLGHRAVPKWIEVKAGDTFAPEWYWWERGDYTAANHLGPLLVHMAPAVPGPTGVNTPGIWTKLYHYAYNTTDHKWSNQYFKSDAESTRGHHFITIPDVPAGDYIIRSEIIALQIADTPYGAQHYPSCVQVRVTTNGTTELPGGDSFPGSYVPGQPGLLWPTADESDPAKYPIPGGPVWEGSPGGGIYGLNA
ncbi:endoglucanase II [Coprinopsis cinerea AmutBmut pab1-1]|nr:endoglucanase II [Coprinopsis cinerea AmutBmut pab1-1]